MGIRNSFWKSTVCRYVTRNTNAMHLTRKQKADIYWKFKNPLINPHAICTEYNLSISQLQSVVDWFQTQLDKKYKSNKKAKIHIPLLIQNIEQFYLKKTK